MIVHHQELFDAMRVQDCFGFFERGADGHRDEIFLGHHALEMGRSKRVSKRRSRLVRMPTSLPLVVTGTPEMRYRFITSSASPIFLLRDPR